MRDILADALYALAITGLVAFSFLGLAEALLAIVVLIGFVLLTLDAHVRF